MSKQSKMAAALDSMMGTRSVPAQQRFDIEALDRYLARRVDGYRAGALAVEQFDGGQSNPTFRLDAHGRHYVLRTKPGPAARLLPSAHAIEREFRVMEALHGTGFPVARPHVLCSDEAVIGRAFYVMEHVEGRILWEGSLPGLAPAERAAIYDEMNRVLARLHGLDHAAIGLAGYGKPGNYIARQIERWAGQYRASQTETIAAMEALIAWLPRHIPAGDDTAVVHGDFRMDNLIFHPTEPRILAVLDWELSTLGHAAADFSYHCLSWHLPPGPLRGIAGLDLDALGIPTQDAYIARYAERTGKRIGRADFGFYLAYNMFRLACIMQGIMKRHLDGTAASVHARDSGGQARTMAELGWRIAQQQ